MRKCAPGNSATGKHEVRTADNGAVCLLHVLSILIRFLSHDAPWVERFAHTLNDGL